MLRLKLPVSVVPLIVAAILARIEFFPSAHPCIAPGAETVRIASAPWHADLHVSFTDDPTLATVRVAISDSAEAVDFAVFDDVDAQEQTACETTPATQMVAISSVAPHPRRSSISPKAMVRIFVRSKRFSAREAAALIVGARGERPRPGALL